MEASGGITLLALVLTLQLFISINTHNRFSFVKREKYGNSAAAAASPLAGTKIRTPWLPPSSPRMQPARRYIPSEFDVDGNQTLTKLLDVGACSSAADNHSHFSYVPPLDGTKPDSDNVLCQEFYGMRFVLFDLKLVNIDTVDSLAGSFTAQFQLVFHWREKWEAKGNGTNWFAYIGDDIETAENASLCGFDCDTTSASKTRCCDRMWVPPLQVPSCKVNDVRSVTPPPYLTTIYSPSMTSYWSNEEEGYTNYSARRTWYVGLDVTCPFTPDFHNFPFDYQFLTVDIINPYASRTWLQLSKGFLEANIVDSIAGINLSPDDKIDGWSIKDFMVSGACGTQQTWEPTFVTQDYFLQILGDQYQSQKKIIMDELKNTKCSEMKDVIMGRKISLSNDYTQPYRDTKNDYMQRLDTTIAIYKDCISKSMVEFKWNTSIDESKLSDVSQFNYSDIANMNRSFSFLDLEYPKAPSGGIDFECLIDAIANLTTPGIRINIIIQRFISYYFIKLILPTCACVGFSFTAFGLNVEDLSGRLTVVVPSAIALSTLQGYVVATDIPAVAYMAPTTYIVILSYITQLLIALESTSLKLWIYRKKQTKRSTIQTIKPLPLDKYNEEADQIDPRFQQKGPTLIMPQQLFGQEIQMAQIDQSYLDNHAIEEQPLSYHSTSTKNKKQSFASQEVHIDRLCLGFLSITYFFGIFLLVLIPFLNSIKQKKTKLQSGYVSLK